MTTFAQIVALAVFCTPCFAGEINSNSFTLSIESLRTNLVPVIGALYVMSGPDLYKNDPKETHNPGPASTELSIAWDMANEFVFRTALQAQYKLPAGSSRLLKNGDATVSFKPRKGDKELTVLVHRRNRAVEIIAQ